MFNLFNKKIDTTGIPVNMDYFIETIYRKYTIEFVNYLEYIESRNRYLKSNNILERLLKYINIDFDYISDIINLLDNSNYRSAARYFKLGSVVSKPEIIYDFFIPESRCMMLLKEDDIPLEITDYRDLKPVKLLDCNLIDFTLSNPTFGPYELDYDNNNDFFLFALDIRELVITYWLWYKENKNMDTDISYNSFISKVIYPQIVMDIFDYSILNYYAKLFNLIFVKEKDKSNMPIMILDYRKQLKKLLNIQYKNLKNRKIDYTQILYNLPTFNYDSMLDLLYTGNIPTNRNNKWLYIASRLKAIAILLRFGGRSTRNYNRSYLHKLHIELTILRNEIVDIEDKLEGIGYLKYWIEIMDKIESL